MPKKNKKGADKEKRAKKKTAVNERETVSYEQQILDNNRQLARLRTRNEHLESEAESLKVKLTELEDDRSDVVAHLKRVLQQKIEESRELSDRLLALEELRKEQQAAFKKKEESMKLEYHTMETNLSAEVKLAAGKLNALEDWRLSRIDLMRKFEIQEEEMAEQEERHRQTLYEAEKSIIIGKAKMQKEMEERLNDLAQSFREATNIRIADATHRAVRENIALNLELDSMYKVCRELDTKTKEHKEKERNLRLHASLFQTEAQMALNKLLEQNRLIDNLAEEHFNMSLAHGKICREAVANAKKEVIIQSYKDKSVEAQDKTRILEQNIQKIKNDRENVLKEIHDDCRQVKLLGNILDAAKRYIAQTARSQERISVADPSCTSCQDFDEKLNVLLNILENHEIPRYSNIEDVSLIEDEGSDRTLQLVAHGSSERVMQTGNERENEDQEFSVVEEKSPETTDLNIPQCLLNDSQSSDITSPKETESPASSSERETT